MDYFKKLKDFLTELGFELKNVNDEESILVLHDEEKGVHNMVIDCEGDLLIMEQHIFDLKGEAKADMLVKLLQFNRQFVHGALCIDDSGKRVIFRDTLQLANLDLNEIEASLNSLSIALSEHAEAFIEFAH